MSPSPSLPTQAARVPGPLPLRKSTRSPVHPAPRSVGFHSLCSLSLFLHFAPREASFLLVKKGVSGTADVSASMRQREALWSPGQGRIPTPSERPCLSCHTLGLVLPELGPRVSVEAMWSGRPALPQVPLLTQDGGGRQRSARAQVYRCVLHSGQVWKRSLLCLLTEGRRSTNRSRVK